MTGERATSRPAWRDTLILVPGRGTAPAGGKFREQPWVDAEAHGRVDDRAAEHAGLIGAEPPHDLRDLFRADQAVLRQSGDQRFRLAGSLRTERAGSEHVGIDRPGAHGVYGDRVMGQIRRQVPGEVGDRRLAHAIGDAEAGKDGHAAADAGDVDDLAVAALDHPGQNLSYQP
jgi:hypothetical protein